MYADEYFEGQDEWNEMRLNSQRTRYSVHIDREHWYEVDGLGLPFERLYFDTREQLVHATNALHDLHAERLRDRCEEFAQTGRSRTRGPSEVPRRVLLQARHNVREVISKL
jgi:hypothetical protein